MLFSSNRLEIGSEAELPINITTKESLFIKAMMFCVPVCGLLLLCNSFGYMDIRLTIWVLMVIGLLAIYYFIVTLTTDKETIILSDEGIELKRVTFMPSTKIPVIPWGEINNVSLVRDEARVCGIALELKNDELEYSFDRSIFPFKLWKIWHHL